MGKEGQGTLIRSASDILHGLTEEVQKIQDAGQSLQPFTNSITGKASQRHPLRANILPAKLPIRQSWVWHEPTEKCKFQSGKRDEEIRTCLHVQPISMSKDEELDALQPKMSYLLTTSNQGNSQRINVSQSKEVITITTKCLPAKNISSKDSKSATLKSN